MGYAALTMATYRIAVIPGDGIGKEVVPEGQRVLEAAGRKHGVEFDWDEYPWSCEYFSRNGRMMPDDGLARIRDHHAIFLGAVGFPGVPDHVSLWGLLIPIRRGFQQYVNLRPVRLFEGLKSPLADRKPGLVHVIDIRRGRLRHGHSQGFREAAESTEATRNGVTAGKRLERSRFGTNIARRWTTMARAGREGRPQPASGKLDNCR